MTRRLCVGVARCRGGRRAENGSADCHQGFKARSGAAGPQTLASAWAAQPEAGRRVTAGGKTDVPVRDASAPVTHAARDTGLC